MAHEARGNGEYGHWQVRVPIQCLVRNYQATHKLWTHGGCLAQFLRARDDRMINSSRSSIGKHGVPREATHSNRRGGDKMARSTGNRGSGQGRGKGGNGGQVPNLPSKTGEPSGLGRGNAPPRGGKGR